ncbi:MAG: Peptidase family S51 [bacterium ADurb.Bin363]|nr:MAG: Peptidase family S51 [bacterium ADurb.Bin363]
MKLYEQMAEIFEIIEPQSTKTLLCIEDEHLGLATLIKEYLKQFKKKDRLTLEDLINFQKFVEEEDLSDLIIPFRESFRQTLNRTIAAYSGKAIFFSDHHHLYQPDRYDVKFADYIHEKICKECYNSMSKVYRYYSVNIGPTLLEWFRKKRPELLELLRKADKKEPILAQTYTHQILPLIKQEEDLRAEILAGIQYRDFVFGPLPEGNYRGIWIPECTISIRDAKWLAKEGVDFIILRSDQSAYFVNTGKPYKLTWKEEDGSSLELKVFYYHPFSKDFSFDKWTTDNPHLTMNHILRNIPYGHLILLAHDGELVHHRWEHCNVDVSGFFKELPLEIYRRKHPSVIMLTPNRFLRFLKMKALLEGKDMSLPETELPDFPTSWSCGGYEIKTFAALKGINVEDLIRSSDENIIRFYAELLIIRKLQGGNIDPVAHDQWEYLVEDEIEKLKEKETFPLNKKRKEEIKRDLYRGANVCYDIRRFNKIKVGGAGRWAFGSLDSGDSDYQTYLREAVMLIEDTLIPLFKEKVNPHFKDMVRAKADFMVFRLDELSIPQEEKFEYLKEIYPAIKVEEASLYPCREEFFEKHLLYPVSDRDREDIWQLLCIWNRMRRAYTSCAYFFDDFNNHVAEDAVLRATESLFLLEEYFNIRLSQDFYEKLKKCKSRYRAVRNQGPDLSADRVAKIHMNILKLEKAISRIEHIDKDKFMNFIKEGKYSLPHPSAENQECYRAFVNDELVGFTSKEGLEDFISRTSREVSRTQQGVQLVVEKRDLDKGDIVSRFRIDVNYDQLEPEKPYFISPLDNDLLLSTEIDENYYEKISSFYLNNIYEYLPAYGIKRKDLKSVFIDPEKIILDFCHSKDKNRKEGACNPKLELHFSEGQKIWNLSDFSLNLRFIRKEIKKIKDDIPGIEEIEPRNLERFYNNLPKLYEQPGIKDLLYGEDGKSGIEGFIKEKGLTIQEGLNLYLKTYPEAFPENYIKVLYKLLVYNLFLKHDTSIGRYELEEKQKRDIALLEAVEKYCKEYNLPYEQVIYSHKLWKYQKDKIKYYGELLEQEERVKTFLSANISVKRIGEEPCYTVITKPFVYVHGAANEAFFEGFYPDNEAIPEITRRHINRKTRVLFLPGSLEMEGQIQYFRKMQRYLLEKFNLQDVKAGIFVCGSRKELSGFLEQENRAEFFLLPSLEGEEGNNHFSEDSLKSLGSKHLDYEKEEELNKFEEHMNKSDIIYLGGGSSTISGLRYNQLIFNNGKSFRQALREFVLRGGLLMGVSAGAMVMGIQNISYVPRGKTLQGKIEGLKMFPGNIQVHYEEYGIPEHLEAIRKEYPSIPIVAIDTQTAVIGKLNLKLTLSKNPFSSEGWHIEGLENIELLKENYTVLGSKSVTFIGEENEEVLFDGMKCPDLSWENLINEE